MIDGDNQLLYASSRADVELVVSRESQERAIESAETSRQARDYFQQIG